MKFDRVPLSNFRSTDKIALLSYLSSSPFTFTVKRVFQYRFLVILLVTRLRGLSYLLPLSRFRFQIEEGKWLVILSFLVQVLRYQQGRLSVCLLFLFVCLCVFLSLTPCNRDWVLFGKESSWKDKNIEYFLKKSQNFEFFLEVKPRELPSPTLKKKDQSVVILFSTILQ